MTGYPKKTAAKAVARGLRGRHGRAEQAPRESEERLRTVVEHLAEGIALFDRDDRLVLCNEVYRRIQSDIAEHIVPGTPFEAIARARAAIMVEMGEAGDVETFTRERMAQHRNATGAAIERKRRDGGHHIIREVRTPAGETVVAFTDVTELNNERNLLRSVLDSLLDHVFVKDREGRYILLNAVARKARGVASEAAVADKTVFDILPRDEAAAAAAEDQSVVSTGSPLFSREEAITLKSGETRWYLTAKIPLRDPAGEIIGVIGINRDVTELHQSAEEIRKLNVELEQRVIERTRQLELTNRELESFAYSVSHDLRAPLRSIDGFSEALLEDYERRLDAQGKDYLRRVRNATQRMDNLIDDLLALSRVTRAELRKIKVDVSGLVNEIAQELRRQESGREVTLTVASGLTATADPNLLRIALQNLLHNAWKFTARQRDAKIDVGVTERDGKQVFLVRDNGVGFDMAYADKLFGAFQRLHSEAEFPGTGIGLATVQRIVHRHGGEVWAKAAVNQGATFFFTLEERTPL